MSAPAKILVVDDTESFDPADLLEKIKGYLG